MGEETALPEGAHPSFARVIQQKQRVRSNLSGVKHKIGVYSAKGGVGKTTIAINLAYTLASRGLKVGLLDADIDCPNVTMFLGMEEKMIPKVPLKPILKDGVKIVSTAMLVDEIRRPIIWRGPILTKMLGDFFENTEWGELDYLIIDLSPGTSDAPLTIMQLLDLDGFIIVTTPQRVAGLNSMRSGLMAKRLGSHIIGIVENMSSGKPSESTRAAAESLKTEVLGCIKSDGRFNTSSDSGVVPVSDHPDIKGAFDEIVKAIIA